MTYVEDPSRYFPLEDVSAPRETAPQPEADCGVFLRLRDFLSDDLSLLVIDKDDAGEILAEIKQLKALLCDSEEDNVRLREYILLLAERDEEIERLRAALVAAAFT